MPSNRLDVALFAGAVVLGAALYLILSGLLGVNSQLVITTALVAVMCVYALAVSRIPLLRVRPDQGGDNAYYLGLLFTLISMAVALYHFQASDDLSPGSPSGVQRIISNFGVALATTIVGIFLRVLLHQMRTDPADIEKVTQLELSEAAASVRVELENLTISLQGFFSSTQQRAESFIAESVEKASESLKNFIEELKAKAADLLTSTSDAHKKTLTETEQATKLVVDLAEQAGQALERLSSIEAPPQLLSRRLKTLAERMEEAGTKIDNVSERFTNAGESAAEAGKIVDELRDVVYVLVELLRNIPGEIERTVIPPAEKVKDAFERMAAELQEKDLPLLKKLREDYERATEEVLRAERASADVLTRLGEVVNEVTTVIRDEAPRHGTER